MHQASRRFVRIRRLCIFVFRLVGSASSAKPAFIVAFVQGLAPFRSLCLRYPTPELTYSCVMKRLRRAHEDVVTAVFSIEPKRRRHLLEIADNIIGLFFRRAIIALRCALDIYAMLIGTGKKERLNSLLSLLTRNRVRYDHRVEMAEMRQAVGVIDRCGDVESFHSNAYSASFVFQFFATLREPEFARRRSVSRKAAKHRKSEDAKRLQLSSLCFRKLIIGIEFRHGIHIRYATANRHREIRFLDHSAKIPFIAVLIRWLVIVRFVIFAKLLFAPTFGTANIVVAFLQRSEERRVGKEGLSR